MQEVQAEQNKVRQRQDEYTHFRAQLKAFRKQLHSGKGIVKKATFQKFLTNRYKGPTNMPKLEGIIQAVAKSLLLSDSFLWRSRSDGGAWNSRYKSFPSRSCKDDAWGSEGKALKESLQATWRWFLDLNGLEEYHCPVEGVF